MLRALLLVCRSPLDRWAWGLCEQQGFGWGHTLRPGVLSFLGPSFLSNF